MEKKTRLPGFIQVWAFRGRGPGTMESAIATFEEVGHRLSSGPLEGVWGASTATNRIVAWAQCPDFSGAQDPDDSSPCVTLQQDWIDVQSSVHDQEIEGKFETARRKGVCDCGEGRQKHQKMPSLTGASLSSESPNRFAPGHTAVTRHGSANPGIHDIAMNHIRAEPADPDGLIKTAAQLERSWLKPRRRPPDGCEAKGAQQEVRKRDERFPNVPGLIPEDQHR